MRIKENMLVEAVWIDVDRIEYNGKLDKIKNRVDMDKVSKQDLKRHEVQKKQ